MFAVKIVKEKTEKVRQDLVSKELLCKDYALKKDDSFVYIPVKKEIPGYEIVNIDLEKIVKKNKSLKSILKNDLNSTLLDVLPNSLDIIGDIAIVELVDELKPYAHKIGTAILYLHKNIKVVAMKAGLYSGVYRTRKLKIIAGEKRKITIHKENNVLLKLNVEDCYFSPRLSTERKRVFEKVLPGESVLVMFSGIGPYVVTISKNTQASKVVGIEINPEAHKYAVENVMLNKLNNVKLYEGDVREIIPKLDEKFDRIIMPLPKTAESFLDLLRHISKQNTVVHLYCFLHESEIPDKAEELLKEKLSNFKILDIIKCGQSSPGNYRICIDFCYKSN